MVEVKVISVDNMKEFIENCPPIKRKFKSFREKTLISSLKNKRKKFCFGFFD